jgi:hypothetical protein
MKAFLVALIVAIAIGAGAYAASRSDRIERPVAEAFTTPSVRL